MRVENQGKSECMLATIAALSDRPLAEVRDYACKLGRVRKWSSMFPTSARVRASKPTFWRVVPAVAHLFGGAPLARLIDGRGNPSGSMGPVRKLPAEGRGVVRLSFKQYGNRRPGHIVPWENGRIYDPADSPIVGYTLAEYLKRNKELSVDFVRTLPDFIPPVTSGNPEDCISPSPDMGY